MLSPFQLIYEERHLIKSGAWKPATIPMADFFDREVRKFNFYRKSVIHLTFTQELRYPVWKEWLHFPKPVHAVCVYIRSPVAFGFMDYTNNGYINTKIAQIYLTSDEYQKFRDSEFEIVPPNLYKRIEHSICY